MVKIISMEFTWKITLNTVGSMRPVIVIVNFLIPNWTPLAHMAAAAQQGQWHPVRKPWAVLEVEVGGTRCLGESSAQCLPKQRRPCVHRHRGSKANTEAQGGVKEGWRREGKLANCGQPCAPCSGVQMLSWPGDQPPPFPPGKNISLPAIYFCSSKKLRTRHTIMLPSELRTIWERPSSTLHLSHVGSGNWVPRC